MASTVPSCIPRISRHAIELAQPDAARMVNDAMMNWATGFAVSAALGVGILSVCRGEASDGRSVSNAGDSGRGGAGKITPSVRKRRYEDDSRTLL